MGISYGLRYVPGTGRDEFLDTASCCEKEHRMISAHVRDDEDRVFGAVAEVAEAGNYTTFRCRYPISAAWPVSDR